MANKVCRLEKRDGVKYAGELRNADGEIKNVYFVYSKKKGGFQIKRGDNRNLFEEVFAGATDAQEKGFKIRLTEKMN